MTEKSIEKMKAAHEVLAEFPFEVIQLEKGYARRWLRVNLDKNEISIHPVTEQMIDLWTGGKGFDLWLTFQEQPYLLLFGTARRNHLLSRLGKDPRDRHQPPHLLDDGL